jgi:hypothetical protein
MYGMWIFVMGCSGLAKLIVILQAQHINNRKYSNSYTINDECRQTMAVLILQCKGNEISIPHVS